MPKYGEFLTFLPSPLTLDRVMEGESMASSAPLFRLPYEILQIIMQQLEDSDLKHLAFVSSDCRQ